MNGDGGSANDSIAHAYSTQLEQGEKHGPSPLPPILPTVGCGEPAFPGTIAKPGQTPVRRQLRHNGELVSK
eukprot:SAG22_NODE_17736_length_299_cov_1.025000_1_plen_70_part_01